jgi:hypothetical protein
MRIARIAVQPLHEIRALNCPIPFPLMFENIIGDGAPRENQSVEMEPRRLRLF